MSTVCVWCDKPYERRVNGGQRQKFCSEPCRKKFHAACRKWAEAEVWDGNLSVAALKRGLQQRTRCSERHLGQQAPQTLGKPARRQREQAPCR